MPTQQIDLSEIIVKALFELGNEPGSPCQRIAFIAGIHPDNEIAQGGLNKAGLTDFIKRIIAKNVPMIKII